MSVENTQPEVKILAVDTSELSSAVIAGISSNTKITEEGEKLLRAMAKEARKIRTEIHETEYRTLVIGACTNLYNAIAKSAQKSGGKGNEVLNLVYKFAEFGMRKDVRNILETTTETSINVATLNNFKNLMTNIDKVGKVIDIEWSKEEKYTTTMISTKIILANRLTALSAVSLWNFNTNMSPLKEYAEWKTSQKEVQYAEASNLTTIAGGASRRLFTEYVKPIMTKDVSEEDYAKAIAIYCDALATVMIEEFAKTKDASTKDVKDAA